MSKYFGTDGFRGEANAELTNDHAFKIGRFLGWYFSTDERPAKIVIGKDTRRSSYMLEYSLVTGISASGGEPYMLHVVTTPCVAYITRTDDFDCGIMISASHNPFYDNGIKLFNSNGEKVGDDLIAKIEAYIDADYLKAGLNSNEDIALAKKEKIGKVEDYFSGRNRYIAYLISTARESYKGLRVGLDPSNGAAYMISRNVFEALGAKVYMINDRPNGLNINDHCGSTHIEALQELVKENKLDVGFAFDGDADRCLSVDENADIISGDQTLYLYARYLKEKGELYSNTVVTTIMSNFGLYKALDELNIGYAKTQVGDKYVYENMVEFNREIGGEDSGHTIFRKYATTGDGILTAMRIMDVMLAKKTSLSALVKPLKIYPQVLKNIVVKDKKATTSDQDVLAVVNKVSSLLANTGRILLRESGTEAKIRVMVEASSQELCEKYVDSVIAVIRAKGYEAN